MGQYWKVVNLDKREYISPHKLGSGLKLWEQLANHPGTGAALIVLCAAMPEARGGGDFDLDANWHGPERTSQYNISPGPMPATYPEIAKAVIGRWAGDRIALVGDYAEPGDLAPEHEAHRIYDLCQSPEDIRDQVASLRSSDAEAEARALEASKPYTDISDMVAKVIEHELHGKFVGDGWREFQRADQPKMDPPPIAPDLIIDGAATAIKRFMNA